MDNLDNIKRILLLLLTAFFMVNCEESNNGILVKQASLEWGGDSLILPTEEGSNLVDISCDDDFVLSISDDSIITPRHAGKATITVVEGNNTTYWEIEVLERNPFFDDPLCFEPSCLDHLCFDHLSTSDLIDRYGTPDIASQKNTYLYKNIHCYALYIFQIENDMVWRVGVLFDEEFRYDIVETLNQRFEYYGKNFYGKKSYDYESYGNQLMPKDATLMVEQSITYYSDILLTYTYTNTAINKSTNIKNSLLDFIKEYQINSSLIHRN